MIFIESVPNFCNCFSIHFMPLLELTKGLRW